MDRWADHVARARAGDRRAAAELVEGNLGMVRRSAARLAGYHVERDELVAEGVLGLLEAIRAHDPERGTAYLTTAMYWVRLRQLAAVQASSTGGTVGRTTVAGRLWWALPAMWADAQQTSDPARSLSDAIAAKTGHRPRRNDAAAAAQAATIPLVHLDDYDAYPIRGAADPEREMARAELAHLVRSAMDRLPPDEREVVVRTVIGDETLTDVGSRESCGPRAARMRMSRILRRALQRLRAELSEAA